MTEQDAREALRERLAEALGAEMYQVLMESTADAWRLWEYLTPAAKDRYRADASRIVTDALLPAVEEYAAEAARAAEAKVARAEAVLADEWFEDEAGAHVVYVWQAHAALDGSPAGSGGEEAGRGSDGRSGASGGPRSPATGSGGVSGSSEGGEGL